MATAVSPASESQGFESIYAINSFYGRKTIIMVGSTGAGKSTLGNLLSGSKMKSYHDREASKNKY
jgi:putative ribosome biogenesis GTPase RsgA